MKFTTKEIEGPHILVEIAEHPDWVGIYLNHLLVIYFENKGTGARLPMISPGNGRYLSKSNIKMNKLTFKSDGLIHKDYRYLVVKKEKILKEQPLGE